MRFKLWLYKCSNGYPSLALEDTSIPCGVKDSWKLRDISIYDGVGKMVWKPASYPVLVRDTVKDNKGICIGEFALEHVVDANIPWKVLNYLLTVQEFQCQSQHTTGLLGASTL